MHVLGGGEVEALLAALVLQQALGQQVGHAHVAAVVLGGVRRGVGQLGGRALGLLRVQGRGVAGQPLRLEQREGGGEPTSSTLLLLILLLLLQN